MNVLVAIDQQLAIAGATARMRAAFMKRPIGTSASCTRLLAAVTALAHRVIGQFVQTLNNSGCNSPTLAFDLARQLQSLSRKERSHMDHEHHHRAKPGASTLVEHATQQTKPGASSASERADYAAPAAHAAGATAPPSSSNAAELGEGAGPKALPRLQLGQGHHVTAHAASASVDGSNYAAKLASHIDHRVLNALVKADASSLAGLTMDITAGNWKGVAVHFGQKLAPKALEAFGKTAAKSGVIKALGEIGGKLGKFFGPLAAVADALINVDDAGSPKVTNIEDHIMPAENVAHAAGVAAKHNRDAAKHLGGGAKTNALLDALDDDKARLIADAAAALYSNGHGFERNPGRDAKTAATREKQDEAAYLRWVGGGANGRT